MKFNVSRPPHFALAAAACVLVFGVAACGKEQGPAERMGQKIDSTVEDAVKKMEQAATGAGQQAKEVGAAISERATEAGKAIDDVALTAKVKTALIAEPKLKALPIDVESRDGVIMLYGTADSSASRDRASQVAASVEGVRSVLNNLKVVAGS